MDDNPYEAPQEPQNDPESGTEWQPTISGWGERFMTRVALAVIMLLWVAFFGCAVFRYIRG